MIRPVKLSFSAAEPNPGEAVTGVNGESLAGFDPGDYFIDAPGGTAMCAFSDPTGNYNNLRENLLGTNQNTGHFNNRLNEDYFLIADGNEQTVFDDSDQDLLVSGGGRDWYFAGLGSDEDKEDLLVGLRSNEEWSGSNCEQLALSLLKRTGSRHRFH